MSMAGPWHSRLSRRERQIMDILFRRAAPRQGRPGRAARRPELVDGPHPAALLERRGRMGRWCVMKRLGLRVRVSPGDPSSNARRSRCGISSEFFDGSAPQPWPRCSAGGQASDRAGARADRPGRFGLESGATEGRSIRGRVTRRRAERERHARESGGTLMSLLAVLTLKVSAILLLALIGALVLRGGSAAARHWVLAVGVVSAATVPALHVCRPRRWRGWIRSAAPVRPSSPLLFPPPRHPVLPLLPGRRAPTSRPRSR